MALKQRFSPMFGMPSAQLDRLVIDIAPLTRLFFGALIGHRAHPSPAHAIPRGTSFFLSDGSHRSDLHEGDGQLHDVLTARQRPKSGKRAALSWDGRSSWRKSAPIYSLACPVPLSAFRRLSSRAASASSGSKSSMQRWRRALGKIVHAQVRPRYDPPSVRKLEQNIGVMGVGVMPLYSVLLRLTRESSCPRGH
jgi:hypothetical protein